MAYNAGLLFLCIGVVCLVAAVVGGGLKLSAREISMPLISSFPRQIILGLIGIVVALYGGVIFSGQTARSEPNSTNPVSIKIDRVSTPIPRCATFAGQGDAPTNKSLWLAVLTPESKEYYLARVDVDAHQHRWISKNVIIGSPNTVPGTSFKINAVLVDAETGQLLRQSHITGGLKALPANFKIVDQIEVERGPDNADCKIN